MQPRAGSNQPSDTLMVIRPSGVGHWAVTGLLRKTAKFVTPSLEARSWVALSWCNSASGMGPCLSKRRTEQRREGMELAGLGKQLLLALVHASRFSPISAVLMRAVDRRVLGRSDQPPDVGWALARQSALREGLEAVGC
jgi:hypothetical protein